MIEMPEANQAWFEMADTRKRGYANAAWIPLRASSDNNVEKHGVPGHQYEFLGVGTVLIPISERQEGEKISWDSLGLNQYGPYAFDNSYKTSETYQAEEEVDLGIYPIIVQSFGGIEEGQWHINQDLIIALKLKREKDIWVCPDEGYKEVIRLKRNKSGDEALIEIRAEYLKDYLAARKMAMRITSYYQRRATLADASNINWPPKGLEEETPNTKFRTFIHPIHTNGMSYGSSMLLFKVSHDGSDLDPDVPLLPDPNEASSETKTVGYESDKVFHVEGQFWRDEWIEPAANSPRIKGDPVPSNCHFIIDTSGKKENADVLNDEDIGRWLWFRPEIMRAILGQRGSSLKWYTEETGNIELLQGYGVHFGINAVDLITVYAADVAGLPEWQKLIWQATNVSPDGGVSKELTMSQVNASPADTNAPEKMFVKGLQRLNQVTEQIWGSPILKNHHEFDAILTSIHRFRSYDSPSLLSLAKDIARLTADSIDIAVLDKAAPLAKGEKLGSLKRLQKVLEPLIDQQLAYKVMGPLFGIYDLRLGDAHLPSTEINDAKNNAGINPDASYMQQGMHMIAACAITLHKIAEILEKNR